MKKCLLLFMLVLFSGCRKKSHVTGLLEKAIVMGDSDSYIVFYPASAIVDIDGNGSNDIELLHKEVRVGPGRGYSMEYRLQCLQNTVFLRGDSAVIPMWQKQKDTVYVSSGKLFKHTDVTTDCNAASGALVQPSYRLIKALRLDSASTVNFGDHFMSGIFDLNKVFQDWDVAMGSNGDTIISCTYITNYCHNSINMGENYFCFRIESNGHYRYGWLMLRNTDPSVIEEVGLEK